MTPGLTSGRDTPLNFDGAKFRTNFESSRFSGLTDSILVESIRHLNPYIAVFEAVNACSAMIDMAKVSSRCIDIKPLVNRSGEIKGIRVISDALSIRKSELQKMFVNPASELELSSDPSQPIGFAVIGALLSDKVVIRTCTKSDCYKVEISANKENSFKVAAVVLDSTRQNSAILPCKRPEGVERMGQIELWGQAYNQRGIREFLDLEYFNRRYPISVWSKDSSRKEQVLGLRETLTKKSPSLRAINGLVANFYFGTLPEVLKGSPDRLFFAWNGEIIGSGSRTALKDWSKRLSKKDAYLVVEFKGTKLVRDFHSRSILQINRIREEAKAEWHKSLGMGQ